MLAGWVQRGAIVVTLAAQLRCEASRPASETTQTDPVSPNASGTPAPLAPTKELLVAPKSQAQVGIPADSAGRLIPVPSVPLPEPVPEPLETHAPMPRDTLTLKDTAGVTLDAEFSWGNRLIRTATPQLNLAALKAAQEATRLKVTLDLAEAGRMRLALDSFAFPLPPGAEFRSRRDRYGHVLVWQGMSQYRVLAPGTLRALFLERRADVTPTMVATRRALPPGKRLGVSTTRHEIETRNGNLLLERADIPGSGGGQLLCRFLLELISANSTEPECAVPGVPLYAKFSWEGGAAIEFTVSSITQRPDLSLSRIFVPPSAAKFTASELPPQTTGIFLNQQQLAAFRAAPQQSGTPPPAGAPGEGLLAVNQTQTLRYLLLDGVPVAWVKPLGTQYIIGPLAGAYTVGWRDFLGFEITDPKVVHLPARVALGEPDAGTP